MTTSTTPTLNRRALLGAIATVPATPAVAAVLSAAPASPAWSTIYAALPAAGASAASIIARAMALVDLVNGKDWRSGLDGDQEDDIGEAWVEENHALFVRAARTPCLTTADALAKLTAIDHGDRYAGGGLRMEANGEELIEAHYLADVRAFLTRLQAGEA